MSTPEILTAKLIGADCVIGHHLAGGLAIRQMSKDFCIQIDKFREMDLLTDEIIERIDQIERNQKNDYYGYNYYRVTSISDTLNIPFMNFHTSIDLVSEHYISKLISENIYQNDNIQKLINLIFNISEIKESIEDPRVIVGSNSNKVGRVIPLFTYSANTDLYNLYFQHGIDTIICMYTPQNFNISDLHEGKNIVEIGHMAGDSIGMNIFLNEISDKYNVKLTKISGLIGG